VEDVITFGAEGGLGAPATQPGPEGKTISTYARLRLSAATGDASVEVSAPASLPLLEPTPKTEAEFVERLGKEFSPEQEYWLGRSGAAPARAPRGVHPRAERPARGAKNGQSGVSLSPRARP